MIHEIESAYRAHAVHLRNFGRRRVKSPEHLEDYLQDAWLLAIRFWPACTDESKRFPWMCTILANVIKDRARKSWSRCENLHVALNDEITKGLLERSHENHIEARIDLERWMPRLSEVMRDEVARRMDGEPAGNSTQKIRYHRAQRRLHWYMTRGQV
jgi:DNA-directed RNA polymerase specialized sigma24 family protein